MSALLRSIAAAQLLSVALLEEAVVEVENKAPHDDAAEAPQSLCPNGHVLTSRKLRGAAGTTVVRACFELPSSPSSSPSASFSRIWATRCRNAAGSAVGSSSSPRAPA